MFGAWALHEQSWNGSQQPHRLPGDAKLQSTAQSMQSKHDDASKRSDSFRLDSQMLLMKLP
jgi:hypothetical protein